MLQDTKLYLPRHENYDNEKWLPALSRLKKLDCFGLKSKGLGIICTARNGLEHGILVGAYCGKMCACCFMLLAYLGHTLLCRFTPHEWLNREGAIKAMKVKQHFPVLVTSAAQSLAL